ncbi:FAD/NAD(P)-binding protein [Stackebrandtia nassauensis]|uniref:Oxidoreductase FAD/NAD(P)-binding domain protein n=1 Tax=Stackebrandtia nassauensis (strain DSM 44728 / CIP 108903 / NRRL B-16338 / NBRC 102104 / LLR-40K-21) TaxID=446470 RepID=D3PVM2_STANL|nr:FAD/NAD(P)-binding protein [Stackebrandtia nassauensis]ADD43136.1 oxidoreductase FAD/NAD(P)-binding domain protein [Stackebrandtia nassauensis DSM 44728]
MESAVPTLPLRYRITAKTSHSPDTVSLRLSPAEESLPVFAAGQFAMLYAFGIGEIPISVSDGCDGGDLTHTIRAVGKVSQALHDAAVGSIVAVRGPFGRGWTLPAEPGRDVLIVAGGVGLAPLRPTIVAAARQRDNFGHVSVCAGAGGPSGLLFTAEYDDWRRAGLDVRVTVDRPGPGWSGRTGLVTSMFDEVDFAPGRTTALLCGPEPMMRAAARDLIARGVRDEDIQVSLERQMRCGTAECGHCQLGPLFICRDGPVVDYRLARPLLSVEEL